jgi:hypothetical protein
MEKYYKEKNCNRLNNHLVFIRVYNFLGGRLEFGQAYSILVALPRIFTSSYTFLQI